MAEETKIFPLRTILTVTTGRLLTEIGDAYELLSWMTMDSPSTFQLGVFSDECQLELFKAFPELKLANAGLNRLDDWLSKSMDGAETGIRMWITELKMLFPEIKAEYAIPQLPICHTVKDTMEAFREMFPDKEVITIGREADEWPASLDM
jgi:hypothetical protein